MMRIIVHIDPTGLVDVEIEPPPDSRERGDRLAELPLVEPGNPEQRGGGHAILHVDTPRNAERTLLQPAVGENQIEAIPPVVEHADPVGIEIAGPVVAVPVNRNLRIAQIELDSPLDDQRSAGLDLRDELRESLLHGLVRAVNVQMVGIGRRHDGRIGMQLQKRAVELVGLDDQARPGSPAPDCSRNSSICRPERRCLLLRRHG